VNGPAGSPGAADMAERLDISAGKLGGQQLDLLLRELGELPTLPGVILRLVDLAPAAGAGGSGAAGAAEQITELIRLDVALTARFLSSSGHGAAPATVPEAVANRPLEWVLSTALSAKVSGLPGPASSQGGLDRRGFWRHCLATACAAEMLAPDAPDPQDAGEAFVCGLLHDVGKLVLDEAMPRSFARALRAAEACGEELSACEQRVIGTDHSVVGRRWARQRRLPEAVQAVNWLAHQQIDAIPSSVPRRTLVGVVSLADALARELRIGFSGGGAPARSSRELAGQVGVAPEAVARAAEKLPEQVARAAERIGLDCPDVAAAQAEALAGANAELGRLNGELRKRAELLAGRAGAFERLRDLVAAIGPDATVTEVVVRIADVLAAALGHAPLPAEPVVAYSIGPGSEAIVAACAGADRMRTFAPAGELPDAPGETGEAPADEALGALLAEADDFIEWADVSGCLHRPLVCGARRVGGVLYPSRLRAGAGGDLFDAIAGAAARVLAVVQAAGRAMVLSEQLAGTSQVLAATQEALAEAKALAAVGQMAAGAAHELNTPLAVISGRAQLMRAKSRGKVQRETWELIAEQAQRISDILSELMEFASPPEPVPAPFDVGELLGEAAEAFRASDHPQAAAVQVDITHAAGPMPPAYADRGQIRGVLLELLANAANAVPAGPRIRLAYGLDEVGDAIVLTVRDDGPGMDEATAGRAFTPFFSFQQAGRRRGLGLSRARRCVENNGGRIWIQTKPGEGTTVYLRLPPAK